MSQELDLEIPYYPLYGNAIIIPENTVFWRGYDPKFPVISDRPSYFGSKFTATDYAKQNGKVLGAFTNKIQFGKGLSSTGTTRIFPFFSFGKNHLTSA